jgi:hypothetical protein
MPKTRAFSEQVFSDVHQRTRFERWDEVFRGGNRLVRGFIVYAVMTPMSVIPLVDVVMAVFMWSASGAFDQRRRHLARGLALILGFRMWLAPSAAFLSEKVATDIVLWFIAWLDYLEIYSDWVMTLDGNKVLMVLFFAIPTTIWLWFNAWALPKWHDSRPAFSFFQHHVER